MVSQGGALPSLLLIIRWPSMAGFFAVDGGPPPRDTNRQPILIVLYEVHSTDPEPGDLASRYKRFDDSYHFFISGPDDVAGFRPYEGTAQHMPGLDFYFSDDQTQDMMMLCDSPERTYPPLMAPLYPGCRLAHRTGRIWMNISFRKQDLPRWLEIKQKTEILLESFVAKDDTR